MPLSRLRTLAHLHTPARPVIVPRIRIQSLVRVMVLALPLGVGACGYVAHGVKEYERYRDGGLPASAGAEQGQSPAPQSAPQPAVMREEVEPASAPTSMGIPQPEPVRAEPLPAR